MDSAGDAGSALDDVSRVRARTRLYRNGHWFASLVFGIVILGAMPFYVWSRPGGPRGGSPLLGRAFEGTPFSSLGNWSTFYWVVAIVAGFGAVVAYYQLRARRLGVQGRLWPAVVAVLVILGLVMGVYDGSSTGPRGFSVLVVIALGLLVLSALERSRPFAVFVSGFFGLALLSFLYTVVNVFQQLGMGGPFRGGDNALPNLVVPGAYLVIGGLLFFAFRGRQPHLQAQLARTTP